VALDLTVIRESESVAPDEGTFFATEGHLGGEELAELVRPPPDWQGRDREQLIQELSIVVPQRDPFAQWVPPAMDLMNGVDAEQARFSFVSTEDRATIHWADEGSGDVSFAIEEPSTFALTIHPGNDYLFRYGRDPRDDVPWLGLEPPSIYSWDTTLKYVVYSASDTQDDLIVEAGSAPISTEAAALIRLPRWIGREAQVFGRVVSHVAQTRHGIETRSDPNFRNRITEALADPATQELAKQVPSLDSLDATNQSDPTIVFVHGTMSTSFNHLSDLRRFVGHLVRFEHDTFLPIDENSDELFQQVQSRLPEADVLLVGHSRGGLVARDAAGKLAAAGRQVNLATFGSPHAGSEIVDSANLLLNGSLGKRALLRNAVGVKTWRNRARGSAVDEMWMDLFSHLPLPLGLRDMEPRGSILRVIAGRPPPRTFLSVGGIVDPASLSIPKQFQAGMVEQPNDGTVSYRSARSQGTPRLDDLDCEHGEYFTRDECLGLIAELMV
jgi:pimeloyl-ACP methyl ester carboxylesterase